MDTRHHAQVVADYAQRGLGDRPTDKNLKENLCVDFTSTRNKGEMMKHSELFLPESQLQTTHQNSLIKENRLNIGNSFKYVKSQSFLFESEVALNYKSYSGNSSMLIEQYVDTLTTSQRNSGFNDGNTWAANIYARIAPTLKKRKLGSVFPFYHPFGLYV